MVVVVIIVGDFEGLWWWSGGYGGYIKGLCYLWWGYGELMVGMVRG